MAEGQQQSFGHQLFGLFGFATKAVDDPRLRFPTLFFAGSFKFTAKHQQFIESSDTMHQQRLLHLFCQSDVSTKSLHLQRQGGTMRFVKATLTDSPYICPLNCCTNQSHLIWPSLGHLPRMQAHREFHVLWIGGLKVCHIRIQQTGHFIYIICVDVEQGN